MELSDNDYKNYMALLSMLDEDEAIKGNPIHMEIVRRIGQYMKILNGNKSDEVEDKSHEEHMKEIEELLED